ncbi:MAG: PH domain-containing protein [Muribaculaceae bacterium]|nr:PH domain-containing protein [Muribaculaceae bacterium]
MEIRIYRSKIGWWVYALIPFVFLCCMVGPILTDSDYWLGIVLAVPFCLFICYVIVSTKYAIRGNEFGVKGLIGWEWFPIDRIESITRTKSILASSALSINRIAIKFSDRSILKSSLPLEISPKDEKGFIADLLKSNPDIRVSSAVKKKGNSHI